MSEILRRYVKKREKEEYKKKEGEFHLCKQKRKKNV